MLSQEKLEFFRFDIECFLRQYTQRKVLYYPNPGNGGDSFIAAGTYQAFERCGVEIEIADIDSDVKDKVVFLSGGGNFVPLYTDIKTAFTKFLGQASKCILLPHTIRGNEDVISRLDGTCTVFCRDLPSFKHVLAVNPSLDVRLSHDMAFHADMHALLNDEATRKAAQDVLTEKLNSLGLTEAMLQSWPSVDMLRLDSESRISAPQSDVDVSGLFMLGVRPRQAEIATWCFLKTISLARHITTDRLHVGIAAALLGVPCTLRDNSYGKNRSVYDHSLKYVHADNERAMFRFKSGMPSAESDEPQSLALSRQINQKTEMFNAERQQLISALDCAREELCKKDDALAAAQQELGVAATEHEKALSELGQARQDLVKLAKDLAVAQQQSADAAAGLARIQANFERRGQTYFQQVSHMPREFGRAVRKLFARLAFHKSGKPRGWVRKVLFHSNGRVRGAFRRWVYRPNGEARRAFKVWLLESGRQSRLAPLADRLTAAMKRPALATVKPAGAILVAADFPPLYDQQSGGLRLKTLIEMMGKLQLPIIFASSINGSRLPGVLGTSEGRIHYEDVLKKAGVVEFTYGAEELDVLLSGQFRDIRFAFLSFPAVAEAFLPIVRHHYPKAKVIYDMVDFHAQRMEREAALKDDAKLKKAAAVMKKREGSLAKAADITIAVSADEKKALLELAPAAIIEVLPNIFEIPAKAPPGPDGRRDVLFLGGFWHTPNGDAAKWFVERIWPTVHAAMPECRFIIAGSNPGDDVLALGQAGGVEVLGYVADLEPLYDSARVCVAPLRFGAGVKGKVGQSMAYGLPVVTTSIGAEGMCLQDGEHLLIADDPDAFARHVITLLQDDGLWIKTQHKAREFVETQFSVRALTEKVEELFHA